MGYNLHIVPGIKGLGNKTAAKLLKEFGSIENLLEQANNIKNVRYRQM